MGYHLFSGAVKSMTLLLLGEKNTRLLKELDSAEKSKGNIKTAQSPTPRGDPCERLGERCPRELCAHPPLYVDLFHTNDRILWGLFCNLSPSPRVWRAPFYFSKSRFLVVSVLPKRVLEHT